MRRLVREGAMLLAACLASGAAVAAEAPAGMSTVDPSHLRVCADPSSLPFSNQAGEGFENRIALRLAEHLGVPVTYTWHPQSMGFVRNTLRARLCDVIVGVVAADELVQTTNPYYRSTYVILQRSGDARVSSLDDPILRTKRIGVVAGTPPTSLLAKRNLVAGVQPYNLVVDTRAEQPANRMVEDLVAGRIDIALLWGPIAGYWAKRSPTPLLLTPLQADPQANPRTDFLISMGLRHAEPEWKLALNKALAELQPEIDAILDEFGVPRLDRHGHLVGAWAEQPSAADAAAEPASAAQAAAVVEPDGYRMDRFRAPVPSTLKGAVVLDAASLSKLIATRRPVLVDVLPSPRKPPGRKADEIWIPPPRLNIPGSSWLPNTGFGELPPSTSTWFADELARLTGGDKAKPLVFYCEPNCWMSWNAAKRAVTELGYTAVHWYPGGAEGWKDAGFELTKAEPLAEPN